MTNKSKYRYRYWLPAAVVRPLRTPIQFCDYTVNVLCNRIDSLDMDTSPPQQPCLYRQWFLLMIFWPVLLASTSLSANESVNEYELKAAYVFNFLKFVEWPQEKRTDFNQIHLCAFSTDPLLPYLKPLEKRQVRGHSIRVLAYDSAEDVQACQVIYLRGISSSKRKDILALVDSRPVLTVGEEGEYSDDDEIINFFSEGGKLRFDINYRQVRNRDLAMSSRLLNLARVSEK